VSTYRKYVAGRTCGSGDHLCPALLVFNGNPGAKLGILRLNNDPVGKACHFVLTLLHCLALKYVSILDLAGFLGENRYRVGIPLGKYFTFFNGLSILDPEFCSVNGGVTLSFSSRIVHDRNFAVAVHYHRHTFAVQDRPYIDEFDNAVVSRFQC